MSDENGEEMVVPSRPEDPGCVRDEQLQHVDLLRQIGAVRGHGHQGWSKHGAQIVRGHLVDVGKEGHPKITL